MHAPSDSTPSDTSLRCDLAHVRPAVAARPRIAEQVQNWLQSSAYQELRKVLCDYHEGILTLRGRVSSFYLKQMAQTLVARHESVIECVNNIEVRAPRGC
ncbi:MAG: BON domain-containing protein [Pirellulales bacterium]|nr:BON domain-containing protein [Pirellulales bacterium]